MISARSLRRAENVVYFVSMVEAKGGGGGNRRDYVGETRGQPLGEKAYNGNCRRRVDHNPCQCLAVNGAPTATLVGRFRIGFPRRESFSTTLGFSIVSSENSRTG